MPRVVISAARRLKQFPDNCLEAKNDKLHCNCCIEVLDYNKKSIIESHLKTAKHVKQKDLYNKSLNHQPRIDKIDENTKRWSTMVEAFTSAGVPLNIFKQNSEVRQWMIQNVKGGNTMPGLKLLRNSLVNSAREDKAKSIQMLKDTPIVIMADESVDIKNRKILNILAKPLQPGSNFRLISSKIIKECNAIEVATQVDVALSEHFIKKSNVLCFISDSTPYMILAGKKLMALCENLMHSTCWAHILHLVSEELRANMNLADKFISSMKSALTKAPARRAHLLQALKKFAYQEVMPPVPVLTRWTTWVVAADYYWRHFDAICDFIKDSVEDSSAMGQLKLMLDNEDLALQLERLSRVSQGLKSSILDLEKDQVPASSVWLNLKAAEELLNCCGLEYDKLKLYMQEKHPALTYWKEVQALDPRKAKDFIHDHTLPNSLKRFLNGEEVPLAEIIKYEELLNSNSHPASPFQFWSMYKQEMPKLSSLALSALCIPASSATVERSFSQLKRIFTSLRTRMTDENLEAHLKISFNKSSRDVAINSDTEDESE